MQPASQTSVDDHAIELKSDTSARQVRSRLEFRFALLSAAGGVVLASGQGLEGGATLAIFFAICGFVFVDRLRAFELPPIGAYLAMASAAAYCVYDFWGLQQQGERQMGSVAMLLVLVQGVLMMQRKSRRILEQMAVFCLLELVVAAIFSDAIQFGLWMIPIALVGGSALSLMSFVALTEEIDVTLDPTSLPVPKTRIGRLIHFLAGRDEPQPIARDWIATASPQSVSSLRRASGPWSRFALLTLSPSILLIAAAYFYVLPRKIPPSRSMASGPALVGFDDEIRMEQLGQVMQNSALAMKVKLTDADSGEPYLIDGSLYIRGNVLEKYQVDHSSTRPVSTWVSTQPNTLRRRSRIPPPGPIDRSDDQKRFDNVHVQITCEPMNQPALFSIAPYFSDGDASDVVHAPGRWTLAREYSEPPFPRIRYEFGTHAFHLGIQTRSIDHTPDARTALVEGIFKQPLWRTQTVQRPNDSLTDLLQFDRLDVPTARRLALQIIDQLPATQRTQAGVAEAMQDFLRNDPRFTYTLNLNAEPVPGMDPVEQFLSLDRRGHCQYFASSLGLMLRSIGIPCRLVVGYRTEEYNNIGKYYNVRQSHAHAWVEALVEKDQIPSDAFLENRRRYDRGAPKRQWLQLDPTPAISESDDGNPEGVDGLMNLANNLWEDYVVEMDAQRQHKDLVDAAGLADVRDSYQDAVGSVRSILSELKSERLAGMEIDWQRMLSPVLPLLTLAFAAIGLAKIWTSVGQKRRLRGHANSKPISIFQPQISFYATVLDQLRRVGVLRRADETPTELYQRVGSEYPELQLLTHWFERMRYGRAEESDVIGAECHQQIANSIDSLKQTIDRQVRKR